MSARRPTSASRRRRRRGRGRLPRVTAGDRLYLLALFALVAVLAVMALGPLRSYTAAADRVDGLRETRERLETEVDRLEDRRERLHDLEEIELMARSELGLVKPDEVPFVVVTPEPELEQVHPDASQDAESIDDVWYRRLGRRIGELFR